MLSPAETQIQTVDEVADPGIPYLPEPVKSRFGPALNEAPAHIRPVIDSRSEPAHTDVSPVVRHVGVVPSLQILANCPESGRVCHRTDQFKCSGWQSESVSQFRGQAT